MKRIAFTYLLNFIFIIAAHSQETNIDSLSENWKELPSAENSITYHYTTSDLNSYLNEDKLPLIENFHFVGFEWSISQKFCKGAFFGFSVYNMVGNSVVINYNKYKLNGIRAGLRSGYKIRILNRLILEPTGILEYGNYRITDKTADSKLKNNSMNLGLDFSIKVIPYINLFNKFAIDLGLSCGYVYKIPNKEWIASKHFDSQISAEPFNWSGWNFALKIGVIEFDQ